MSHHGVAEDDSRKKSPERRQGMSGQQNCRFERHDSAPAWQVRFFRVTQAIPVSSGSAEVKLRIPTQFPDFVTFFEIGGPMGATAPLSQYVYTSKAKRTLARRAVN